MNKKVLLAICLVGGAAIYIFFQIKKDDAETFSSEKSLEEKKYFSEKPNRKITPRVSDEDENNGFRPSRNKIQQKRRSELSPTKEERKVMFKTPVKLYGQVLDQFDDPVIGAKVTCSRAYSGSMESPLELVSKAPEGRFTISGFSAFAVTILVYPPEGYERGDESGELMVFGKAPQRILKNKDFEGATPDQKKLWEPIVGRANSYEAKKEKPEVFRVTKIP